MCHPRRRNAEGKSAEHTRRQRSTSLVVIKTIPLWMCNVKGQHGETAQSSIIKLQNAAHLVLGTREAVIVPVVNLAFVAHHAEQLVFIHRRRAQVSV